MCYTSIIDGKVFRGCVGDEIFPNKTSIRNCSHGGKCEVCSGDFCNKKLLTDTCIQCNSADHGADCKNTPNLAMQVACTLQQSSTKELSMGCYLNVTGDTYTRGCVQDLNFSNRRLCQRGMKGCQICTSANCNQKVDFNINCYECNGRNNKNCALGENMTETPCNQYTKTCVTGIDGVGLTHRQCVLNHDQQLAMQFSRGYKTCSSNLCNGKIYPENRIKCYECDGFGCDRLDMNTTKLMACTYVQQECYTYINKGFYYKF